MRISPKRKTAREPKSRTVKPFIRNVFAVLTIVAILMFPVAMVALILWSGP